MNDESSIAEYEIMLSGPDDLFTYPAADPTFARGQRYRELLDEMWRYAEEVEADGIWSGAYVLEVATGVARRTGDVW